MPPPSCVFIIKESGSIDTQCIDDLLPSAARMAFKQPATITVMNAETVVLVLMSRTTGSPPIADTGHTFQLGK
jgi:hypothetical protein